MKHSNEVKLEYIRKKYSSIATNGVQGGCCSSGCGCGQSPVDGLEASKKLGYSEEDFSNVPQGANLGLGCGNPVAMSTIRPGQIVLDLGSGGGLDCFIASKLVGDTGRVIGVDMTPEMISLARKNARENGYGNVEFRLGEIEHLPVADESVDIIISNCVVNLSLDKQQVFHEAFRVLKHGGRVAISDIVATAELPEEVQQDLALLAGCVAGAQHYLKIETMLKVAGFSDIACIPKDSSREILRSWAPQGNLEDYVASFLIKAVKP